jgi:hypothetical protein
MISAYVWILPATIVAGWILSWWRARWVRWSLLSAGVVASVLCAVAGFQLPSPALDPQSGCTREQVQCMDFGPVPWLESGLIALACCVVLLFITTVAELVIWSENRAAARSPH